MFVCVKCCHENDQWKFMSNMMISVGNCEICGKTGDCIESDRVGYASSIVKKPSVEEIKALREKYLNDVYIKQCFDTLNSLHLQSIPVKMISSIDGTSEYIYSEEVERAIKCVKENISEWIAKHYSQLLEE